MSSHPGHHIDKCAEHGTIISQCGCVGNGPKPLTEFPCHPKFSCHRDFMAEVDPVKDAVWEAALRGLLAEEPKATHRGTHPRLTPTANPGPEYKFCHGCHDWFRPQGWHECPMKFISGLPDGYGIRSLYIRLAQEE